MDKNDIFIIKSLSKEDRVKLAAELRKDPDLFNISNGIGGLSENALIGRVCGSLFENKEPLKGVEISFIEPGKTAKTIRTNQYGYYQIDLNEGIYTVTAIYGEDTVSEEVKVTNGETSVFYYDFGEQADPTGKYGTTPPDETENPDGTTTPDETENPDGTTTPDETENPDGTTTPDETGNP